LAAVACAAAFVAASSTAAARTPQLRAQIVGGQTASPGTLPQLAWIEDATSDGTFLCTGTVLSSDLVLTAGHCVTVQGTVVQYPASGFHVITGRLDVDDTSTGQVSGVSQVIVNPGYDPTKPDGDVALLELSTPTTAPAMALANTSSSALVKPGSTVQIAGWGLTNGSDPLSIPSDLQWATTVIQSSSLCAQQATAVGSSFDSADQLCTMDTPTDATTTCEGDSGGPLIANYLTDDPIQIGVTDWGIGNSSNSCLSDAPDYFTLASAIYPWAQSWIKKLAPTPTPTPTPSPTPAPLAGRYSGRTSQHKTVKLRVAASRTTVRSIRLSYRLRCSSGRRPSYTVTAGGFTIADLAFGARLRGRNGETYKLTGRFNTTGRAKGTMKTTWHSARYGRCHAGPIHWKARR
jgi:secreted trypsin-like serine protease